MVVAEVRVDVVVDGSVVPTVHEAESRASDTVAQRPIRKAPAIHGTYVTRKDTCTHSF
jgi:hypothetical protein